MVLPAGLPIISAAIISNLDNITTLVLDEFDKSLELGFTEEMSFIIGSLKNVKKRILTSATYAVPVPDFIGLKDPIRLDFIPEAAAAGKYAGSENHLQPR